MVEDDRKISLALAVRLKSSGYRVLAAYDALAGLTLAARHEPDLVVLDIAMPAGDGLDVAEKIQNRTNTVGTPMIIITASREPGLKERATELGAVAYFEKPFRASNFLAAVRYALREEAPNDAVAHRTTPEPIRGAS